MMLAMFSLAGVPPTVGFYAKFSVIEAAVDVGLVWLAVVAVMASLVGAFYYVRIVKLMYFDDPVERRRSRREATCRCCCRSTGSRCLFFGIFPQQLMGMCVVALTSRIP